MSEAHDRVRELLGAHVLGGLDAGDRRSVEEHLPTCGGCRAELARYAPLPALLGRVARRPDGDDAEPAAGDPAGAVPVQLLHAVDAELGRHRRSRLLRAGAAVAVAAAVLLTGVLVGRRLDQGTDPVGVAFVLSAPATGPADPAQGEVVAVARPWGASLTLQVSGLLERGPFRLEVRGAGGVVERAATWGPTPSGVMQVVAATSLAPEEITGLTVVTDAGEVLGSG